MPRVTDHPPGSEALPWRHREPLTWLNQTLVRAILRHDLAVKHPEAVAVKTGITWGA